MADEELLSQQEIDALLAHNDSAEDSESGEVAARPYQLGREQSPSRGRLPTLEMIAERFSRRFADSLRDIFRREFEVGPGGVQTQSFSDYCQSASLPVNLSVCEFSPLTGLGLLTLDAQLVYQLVDHYFGGSGATAERTGQSFSPTEQRVIQRIRERLFADWDSAWQDVLQLQSTVVDEESNPNLLNAFAAGDLLTFVTFAISFGQAKGGISIGLPYKALEEHRALLDSLGGKDGFEPAAHWKPRIAQSLLDAPITFRCQIASAEVQLKDVMNLRVGDVLQAEVPDSHQAFVENVPLFRGKLGESAGKLALEFQTNG